MSVDWFRSWHGAPIDPKWRVIAKRAGARAYEVSAVAWALLDHASQADDRGSIAEFDFETYAEQMDMDEAKVRAIVAALEEKTIIIAGRIAKWEKRQRKREDDAGDRVTRHRKRAEDAPRLPLENVPEEAAPRQHISAPESQIAASGDAAVDIGAEDESEPQAATDIVIGPEAGHLADTIAIAAGHDLKFVPPTWCGAALRVEMWLQRGWSPPLILESVKAQMARKRDGPPGTVRYFEKGIARAHADSDAPFPIVQPVEQETIHAKAGNSSGGFGIISAALRQSDDAEHPGRGPGHLRLIDGS